MAKRKFLAFSLLFPLLTTHDALACGPNDRCLKIGNDGFCRRDDFDKRYKENKTKFFTLHQRALSTPELKQVAENNMKEAEQAFKAVEAEMDRFCDIEQSKSNGLYPSSSSIESGQCGEMKRAGDLAKNGVETVEGLMKYLETSMRRAGEPLQKAFATAQKNLQLVKQREPKQAANIEKLLQELDSRVYESGSDAITKRHFNDPYEKKRNELKARRDRLAAQGQTVTSRLGTMDCNTTAQKEAEVANTSIRLPHEDARACGLWGCQKNSDGTFSPKYMPQK